MGRLRLRKVSRLAWSRLGFVVSCTSISAGASFEFGPGWGLMVAGVLGGGSCLLLVDVEPGKEES